MSSLPLLPTSVVGSHGKPGWWFTLVRAHEAGDAGPGDLDEMFDDAADAAIRDMERAGIDVITDGEVRRLDGYVDSYYAIIKGIQPLPVRRKVGPWRRGVGCFLGLLRLVFIRFVRIFEQPIKQQLLVPDQVLVALLELHQAPVGLSEEPALGDLLDPEIAPDGQVHDGGGHVERIGHLVDEGAHLAGKDAVRRGVFDGVRSMLEQRHRPLTLLGRPV